MGRGRHGRRRARERPLFRLSHLTPAIDSIDDETWRAPVANYFKGEIIVGKDLMVV